MKILIAGLAVASLAARATGAQSPSRPPASIVGTWRGTSVCLVRPSPCNDEVVVYRIAKTKAADTLTMDARKIVRGEEQEMGVLTCRLAPAGGPLTCTIPQGTWQFRVRNDSLIGELRRPDNTKFRDVRAARETIDPVGCYRFDRRLGHSATGDLERSDSTWYSLRLLAQGAVARPELASANWRDLYAKRSSWKRSHDTLFVRVFTGLVGWDLVLLPRDSTSAASAAYAGVARYLSDALGGPPVVVSVHGRREACRS